MKIKFFIGVLFVATFVFFVSGESLAMSKTLNFLSNTGSKVSALFGRGSMSYSRCSNCESVYSGPKPPVGSGLPVWQHHHKGEAWTKYTLEAIDKEGLALMNPKDATVYCPNWNKTTLEQRRSFWLNFASKLAEQESGFRSTQSFYESRGAALGKSSNGLFSMSKGDACGILKTNEDTFNDEKNISCAIKTMKIYLNNRGGYIGTGENKGLGYYWQPLNDNPQHYVAQTKANKKAMLNFTRSLPFCKST